MDLPAYVLLSHEQALKRRLDIVANNMANTSTVGFKREQPLFREFVEQADDAITQDAKKTSFVLDYHAVHDMAAGAFQPTGNALDVMIDGPGYLAVELPDGAGTAYTRAGFITVLENGDLAVAGGQRLLDEAGQPIIVPPEQVNRITISSDGTVLGPDGPLGRVGITVFDDETGLAPRGDGLYSGAEGRVLAAADTVLRAGGVEGSNVQPILETTAMIEILRLYQNSVRMAESLDDMRKRALDKLGRVG